MQTKGKNVFVVEKGWDTRYAAKMCIHTHKGINYVYNRNGRNMI